VDEDWSSTTQLSGAVVEIACTEEGGGGLAIADEDWSSTTQLSGAVVEISCT
jgi:hypothetical protein